MRAHYMNIVLILSFVISLRVQCTKEKNRRILHQPLFPVTSAPPPEYDLFQPPPSAAIPDSPDQDQPFTKEFPTGPVLQWGQPPPPPLPLLTPPASGATAVTNQITTTQAASNPIKKVAVAISSGILTLGMLSAFAFYLYKHHATRPGEPRKLVGGNSRRINEESRIPPSTTLHTRTAEPSTLERHHETGASGSLYRKLNSGKRFDTYRSSIDLQSLPRSPNAAPPSLLLDDDEIHETCFYAPQGTFGNNDQFPSLRHYYLSNKINSQANQAEVDKRSVSSSVPHSKRTSPRSRFSASSSPDVTTQSKKLSLPPSPSSPPSPPSPTTSSLRASQPTQPLSYTSSRAKFSSSPPQQDIEPFRSVRNDEQKKYKIPTPPPPPPPLQLSISRKYEAVGKITPLPNAKQLISPKPKSPSPKVTLRAEKTSHVEDIDKETSYFEKVDAEEKDGSKTRFKPLHWDKVRATSDRATVWDQLNSSSFQLNEDAIDSLFGRNYANSVPKQTTRKSFLPSFQQENRVLDSKKSQNIAIMLRALNVTREEVSEALLDGTLHGLGPEFLETLVKMAPTKEEEIKLKDFNGESSKLGPAERFLKTILDIPFAFKRVEAMLYRANFDTEVKYLRQSFQTLEEASKELKTSRLFLKLLEAVLRTGNRMNDGTNRGDARAFKLDTLLKLVDIKATDGKTTLVHFVVQEIIRSEGVGYDPTSEILSKKTEFIFKEEDFKKQGLQVVAGLSKELSNVKEAAGMDSDVLSSYVSKLETGIQKVKLVLQCENEITQGKFFDSMKVFVEEAGDEISRIKAEERKALSLVKDVTQYFHGDAAKVEAHPSRIFIIVRDFLNILDSVCKDVGRMQDRTTIGAGRSFRIPVTASLPALTRYKMRHDTSSDDDGMF